MSKKSVRPAIQPQLSRRQEAADCINQALEKSDAAEICNALADATRLYNITDLAQKSGLARQSIIVRLQLIQESPSSQLF